MRVKDVGEVITGGTPSKDNPSFYGTSYPLYKPSDLEQGDKTILAMDMLSEEGFRKARQLPVNSVLVTCIGSVGKTGLIKRVGSCNQQINAIIPEYSIVIPKFLYFICISEYFRLALYQKVSSTTIDIVNKGRFSEIYIPLPPLAEQQRIVERVEQMLSIIED